MAVFAVDGEVGDGKVATESFDLDNVVDAVNFLGYYFSADFNPGLDGFGEDNVGHFVCSHRDSDGRDSFEAEGLGVPRQHYRDRGKKQDYLLHIIFVFSGERSLIVPDSRQALQPEPTSPS